MKPFFFDLETYGLDPAISSIAEIAYGSTSTSIQSHYADPVTGTTISAWSRRNILSNIRKQESRETEKEILSRFLHTVERLPQGTELLGWNIGYPSSTGGFDMPFLQNRARTLGLGGFFERAIKGKRIRDIGLEYSSALVLQVRARIAEDPTLLSRMDEKIVSSAEAYASALERKSRQLGLSGGASANIRQVTESLAREKRFKVAGWSQERLLDISGIDYDKTLLHQAHTDTSLLAKLIEEAPSPSALRLTGEQAVEQVQHSLQKVLSGMAVKATPLGTPERLSEILARGAEGGLEESSLLTSIGTEVERKGGSMAAVRAGKGISENYVAKVISGGGRVEGEILSDMKRVFAENPKIGIGIGIAAALLLLKPLSLFSGFDDEYNTNEGLQETGVASELRKSMTDFGSGWRGLPTALSGQKIAPELLGFRGGILSDPFQKEELEADLRARQQENSRRLGSFRASELFAANTSQIIGINQRNKDLRLVRLSQFKVDVDDADTLVLHRGGEEIQIRLAGIDAPEVAGHEDDPLEPVRIWQDQPMGNEGTQLLTEMMKEDENLSLLVSTGRKTYGRYLGAIIGSDGRNLNLDLLSSGAVSALPFGPREWDILDRRVTARVEEQAVKEKRGMWGLRRYQAINEAKKGIGRAITHNTLTRMDKMAQNLNLAAYGSFLQGFGNEAGSLTEEEAAQARRLGRKLRKTHGPPSARHAPHFSGKDDAWNSIEGLNHEGIAWQLRQMMTPFGSGWDALRNLLRKGEDMLSMTGSKEFQAALSGAKKIRELGRGGFGAVHEMKGVFRGQEFTFARKILHEGSEVIPGGMGSLETEFTALQKLQKEGFENAPTPYALRETKRGKELDMELFQGRTLDDALKEGNREEILGGAHGGFSIMENLRKRGMIHYDIQPGNLMMIPQGEGKYRVGLIDYGFFGKTAPGESLTRKEVLNSADRFLSFGTRPLSTVDIPHKRIVSTYLGEDIASKVQLRKLEGVKAGFPEGVKGSDTPWTGTLFEGDMQRAELAVKRTLELTKDSYSAVKESKDTFLSRPVEKIRNFFKKRRVKKLFNLQSYHSQQMPIVSQMSKKGARGHVSFNNGAKVGGSAKTGF